MAELQVAVEAWIASLPEGEFRALCYRTRPPDEPLPAANAERKATAR
jgi:hypothetical protein